MLFETSWDDGSMLDLKLIDLLKKYEMPATFYMPIRCDLGMFKVREIAKDFEIGCHTYSHPQDMKLLSEEELHVEIKVAKEVLEKVIDKTVTKFCYPRGRYNDFVKAIVKEAGFEEARTTKVGQTTMTFDMFEKPTTIHAYQRSEYNGHDWLEVAKKFYAVSKVSGYFHLWGHSAEVEKHNDWDRLEKLFKHIYEDRNS